MDSIRLENMQFYAYHGNNPCETENGQRFEADIELKGNLRLAGVTDDLNNTWDYDKVYQIVSETITGSKYKLMEALAEKICNQVLHIYPNAKVKVTIRKPNPPLPGVLKCAEVEIIRGPVPDQAIKTG